MASPINNKTSSSPPIPDRPNPKPRNSEAGDPMRRSFGGNPFPTKKQTLLGNPIKDFSRQNSTGRESNRNEFGDKENSNEHISNVTRIVPSLKGTKNFMSPTISAVSKINPSPRKKVLSDKNEWSRSSISDTKSNHQTQSCVSFSDVVTFIGEDKDEELVLDEKKQLEKSPDMTITDYNEYFDSRFRISPCPSHEVDPLVAPYDPKKNYLSPRPQFLHYRPNPRIEQHLDECKQLEKLFISESSSDSELSAEESRPESCEEPEEDVAETEEQIEPEKNEKLFISESSSDSELPTDESRPESCEEQEENEAVVVAEAQEKMVCKKSHPSPKQSRFRTFRFLGWLLLLVVSYLLVSSSFSEPKELSFFKDSSFYKFHIPVELTRFAKANNFELMSEKFWMWAESALYMDKLISRLGEKEYGPLQFHNLTDIFEDRSLSDAVFQPTSVEISVPGLECQGFKSVETDMDEENADQEPETPLKEKNRGENNLEDVYEEDSYINELEQESGGNENSEVVYETDNYDTESNESDEKTEIKTAETSEAQNQGTYGVESEVIKAESIKELEETESTYVDQFDVEESAINGQQEKETYVSHAESGPEGEIAPDITDLRHDDLHPRVSSSNKAYNDLTEASPGSLSGGQAVSLYSAVVVLLAATAFLIAKKVKPVIMMLHEAPGTEEHVTVENLTNKEDSKNNNSSNKLLKRRESMGSSASEYSIGDPVSYGSFTTYERIPMRNGQREEEVIITPVRRSSRIRKHQHSGQ